MKSPPPLVRAAALFLDVDGTLLDIAPRPELVEVPSMLPPLLQRLANERAGALALVSGRPISQLDHLFQPWRGAAAGLHGAERRQADSISVERAECPGGSAALAALDRLRPRLRELTQRWSGVWLEDKSATLALHCRSAPAVEAELRTAVSRLVEESGDGLRVIAGKRVVELQPALYGKDGAIAAFLGEIPFCGRLPVFLGDDTTDEDGFEVVNRRGGLSIRVGEPAAATAAEYRLPSVAAALAWLAGE